MLSEEPEIADLRRRLAALRERAAADDRAAVLLAELTRAVDDLEIARTTPSTAPLVAPSAAAQAVNIAPHTEREVALPVAREAAPGTTRDVPPAVTRDEEWIELLADAYLCTDARGIVRQANDRAATLLHVPRYFLVGRPLVMFVDPSQRGTLRDEIGRLAQTGSTDGLELRARQWGGELVPVTARATTVYAPDGGARAIRWLLREVNAERPAASEERAALAGEGPGRRLSFLANIGGLLARSFEFERTLNMLANASIPLLGDWCFVDVIDDEARIHRLATARTPGSDVDVHATLAARAPELTQDDNLIARIFQYGRPELAREAPATLAAMLAADEAQRDALRQLTPRSLVSVPLVARGSVLGVLTFVMAHSGRRHTTADLHLATELATRAALLADHARLYRAAQQASQAKSDFLAAMSHELRTPLTAIVGYTDLLVDEIIGPVSAAQREKLLRIRASSNHLLVLIDEILTFARLEAGRDEVHPAPVLLHDIVNQAVSIVGPQVTMRGLAMRVELPSALTPLRTDPGRLRQILVNLLANAAKFTAHGEVGIRAVLDDGWATFDVWDTGIGIAREHLDAIFSPFWQVEQRATRQYGGTGLGLSVVRRLAHLLGGTVEVSSELGVGSRFVVRIPRELPETPPAPLSAELPPPQPPRDPDPTARP